MPSSSEIRNRILSVQKTQKITNAMHLIASTKLNRAKMSLENTRPYFETLQKEIKRIFRTVNEIDSPYFYPTDENPHNTGIYGALVITGDKGLAGPYNHNVIREAKKLIKLHSDIKLFVVGDYGRRHYMSKNIPIEQSFLYAAQNPTLQRAREITEILLEQFDTGQIKKLFLVYTDIGKNGLMQAKSTRLIPFKRTYFNTPEDEEKIETKLEFEPDAMTVLDGLVRSYLYGFIYSALVDSYTSEQSSRMNAMNTANENAQELLDTLKLDYNKARQADITREITEISSGAVAQKNKRKKEEAL